MFFLKKKFSTTWNRKIFWIFAFYDAQKQLEVIKENNFYKKKKLRVNS